MKDAVETVQVNGTDYLTSNKKSSVTIVESEDEPQIGISDPTQANGGTIEVEIHRATTGALSPTRGYSEAVCTDDGIGSQYGGSDRENVPG